MGCGHSGVGSSGCHRQLCDIWGGSSAGAGLHTRECRGRALRTEHAQAVCVSVDYMSRVLWEYSNPGRMGQSLRVYARTCNNHVQLQMSPVAALPFRHHSCRRKRFPGKLNVDRMQGGGRDAVATGAYESVPYNRIAVEAHPLTCRWPDSFSGLGSRNSRCSQRPPGVVFQAETSVSAAPTATVFDCRHRPCLCLCCCCCHRPSLLARLPVASPLRSYAAPAKPPCPASRSTPCSWRPLYSWPRGCCWWRCVCSSWPWCCPGCRRQWGCGKGRQVSVRPWKGQKALAANHIAAGE